MELTLSNNSTANIDRLQTTTANSSTIQKHPNNTIISNDNNTVKNTPILSRETTLITDKKLLIEYIRNKINFIEKLEVNLFEEYSYESTTKTSLAVTDILNCKINLADNCFVINLAIFDCFVNPQSKEFLGDDFRIKLVGLVDIDSTVILKVFKDSKDLTKNEKPHKIYHCYLIIENSNFDTNIIVDLTTTNYRTDENTFIGTTTDLLNSLLDLITNKQQYYKSKIPFHAQNNEILLKINSFIIYNVGNERSIANSLKYAWYGSQDNI